MIDLVNAQRVSLANKRRLPKTSGVYVVISGDDVVYVGASVNIRNRWGGHHRIDEIKQFENVEICYFEMPINDAARLEQLLINQLRPALNSPRASVYTMRSSNSDHVVAGHISVGWTPRHEDALQAVYQQMREAGIPCERAGKPNVTVILQYALEQTAKAGKLTK